MRLLALSATTRLVHGGFLGLPIVTRAPAQPRSRHLQQRPASSWVDIGAGATTYRFGVSTTLFLFLHARSNQKMAADNRNPPEAAMDANALYREEIITD